MPVEMDNLEEWAAGDRMLRDILRGMDAGKATEAEWRRGTLPPGQLGWRKAKEIRTQAAGLAAAALRHRRGSPDAYDIDLPIGDGRRLTGTATPVFGTRTVSVTYSRLSGKHLLESWIPLLALKATSRFKPPRSPRCSASGLTGSAEKSRRSGPTIRRSCLLR